LRLLAPAIRIRRRPKWLAYTATSRDTMLSNNECRVAKIRIEARLVMEQILKL
jgi:hypothetical protein